MTELQDGDGRNQGFEQRKNHGVVDLEERAAVEHGRLIDLVVDRPDVRPGNEEVGYVQAKDTDDDDAPQRLVDAEELGDHEDRVEGQASEGDEHRGDDQGEDKVLSLEVAPLKDVAGDGTADDGPQHDASRHEEGVERILGKVGDLPRLLVVVQYELAGKEPIALGQQFHIPLEGTQEGVEHGKDGHDENQG
ncbi:hypothetical protein SDC9_70473 [bioreactor metagenome]|uniref:Uncharacterized protein n=1 Tax=bioreactor metagenome TaxID=1076179 RepID=A0A644Y611_9ZZZZ